VRRLLVKVLVAVAILVGVVVPAPATAQDGCSGPLDPTCVDVTSTNHVCYDKCVLTAWTVDATNPQQIRPAPVAMTARWDTIPAGGAPHRYAIQSGHVTIQAGATSAQITIQLLQGVPLVPDQFQLRLSEPSAGGVLNGPWIVTIAGGQQGLAPPR
jgi:hypothetical protein